MPMIPTPEEVLPLVVPAVPALRAALRRGIDFADDLQPDPVGARSVVLVALRSFSSVS
jgi:hypothetical protein